MDAFSATEFIGYAAGTIICLSAAPHILTLIRRPEYGRYEPVTRTGLIVAGNLLWFAYGILTASAAMTIMSAIGCALNMVVLYFAVTARHVGRITDSAAIFRRAPRNAVPDRLGFDTAAADKSAANFFARAHSCAWHPNVQLKPRRGGHSQ